MKKSILAIILTLFIATIASAQKVSQNQFFELTEQDSMIATPIKLVFHEGSIIVESDFIQINSIVKRKKKRRDKALDFWLENKCKIRLYFKQDSSIKTVFIYIGERTFYIAG